MQKKSKMGKIIAALTVACVYIFVFGIIQVVTVSADSSHSIDVDVPVYTTPASSQTTKPPQNTKPSGSTTSQTDQSVPPEESSDAPDPNGEDTPQTEDTNDEHLEWQENEYHAVMYVNTDGIYSREQAIMGSTTVKMYNYGDKVTVVAWTDTEYYMLEDSTFIHSAYLSENDPFGGNGGDPNNGGGTGDPGNSDEPDNSGGSDNSGGGSDNSGDNSGSSGGSSDNSGGGSDNSGSGSGGSDNSGSSGGTTDGNERFTVYDQVSGTTVSGSAYNIVVRTVINEIGTTWPDEAIKAQAVAAYTHIKKENQTGNTPTVALQPFSGATDRVLSLIDEVFGEAIYYNGELINCCYFASSCGYTNSAENEWGGSLPYLVSVDCPFDSSDPNYGTKTVFTSAQVKDILSQHNIKLPSNKAKWITVSETLGGRENGWVTKAAIGTAGDYLHGKTIRADFSLPSEAFTVKYNSSSDTFVFTTYGYGHGVGMSQNGAKILAENGYTYVQILKHYFTGVSVG